MEEAALSITFTEAEIKKFWSKTGQINESGCIPWTGLKNHTGYGIVYFKRTPKKWRAHRVSYLIKYGAIPRGHGILHSCDNPSCVNVDHLSSGTHAENMRQAAMRGRMKGLKGDLSSSRRFPECRPRGIMNHFSKLTEIKVAEILFYFQYRGATIDDLSRQYQVSITAIKDVVKRKTWIHVPFPSIEILAQQTK